MSVLDSKCVLNPPRRRQGERTPVVGPGVRTVRVSFVVGVVQVGGPLRCRHLKDIGSGRLPLYGYTIGLRVPLSLHDTRTPGRLPSRVTTVPLGRGVTDRTRRT